MKPFKQTGQAVIEFILSVGGFAAIFISVQEVLAPAIEINTADLIAAREAIWERVRSDDKTSLSGDYRLNKHTEIFFDPINKLLPIGLEGDNLRVLKPSNNEAFYPMARLNNSWQAQTPDELSSRPASLVVNNALSGEVVRLIQEGIGWIFLAEELSSDSLIFGTISPDVVPPEAHEKKD